MLDNRNVLGLALILAGHPWRIVTETTTCATHAV
jgi:hypothetical protein